MFTFKVPVASLLPLTALALLAPATGMAQPVEPYIKSVAYAGSGCPQGSVGLSLANDRRSATLIYDSFVSSSGPGVPAAEAGKDCAVKLKLRVAPGWNVFTLAAARRGYVQVPAGMTASSNAAYTLAATPATAQGKGNGGLNESSQGNYSGPVAQDYLRADGNGVTIHLPNSCEQTAGREQEFTIALATLLAPAGGAAQGQITLDSLDVSMAVIPQGNRSKTCP